MNGQLFGFAGPIPILSYWEPWLSLHIAGFKRHETRNRLTRVRGLIAQHSAKKLITDVSDELAELCDFALGADWREPGVLPLGCVRSVSDLTGCFPTDFLAEGRPPLLPAIQECDLLAGDYDDGRFGWCMDATRALKDPLPLLGGRGWFRWMPPPDLEARLLPAVDHFAAAKRWDARHAA